MAVARLAARAAAPQRFDSVKTFSATLAARRTELGDVVTAWLQAHREIHLVDMVVTQSSDAEYHCLTITLFYWARLACRGLCLPSCV